MESQELKGGNLDIDLFISSKIQWKQDKCPWNEKEGKNTHKCAVKNISICKYFQGIKKPDIIICSYPKK